MTRCLLISLCLFIIGSSFCQEVVKSEMTKSDYLRKSKNYKITGGIILGSGLAISAIGGIIQLNDNANTEWFPSYRGAYTAIAGGCIAVLSTPFFIVSGVNRRKAFAISLDEETVMMPGPVNLTSVSLPVISLKVNLE